MKIKGKKKGDKVIMHTCWEADYYKNKVWTCTSDESMD